LENHPESFSLAFLNSARWGALLYSCLDMFPIPERNTPPKTLESWKQIAAYLNRSERTVRRWEASEGLPVHRRGHQKYDTVFAYKHEVEAWTRRRTRFGSQDLLALLRREAARQESEEAHAKLPGNQSKHCCPR